VVDHQQRHINEMGKSRMKRMVAWVSGLPLTDQKRKNSSNLLFTMGG
jgi:hypothetical protein